MSKNIPHLIPDQCRMHHGHPKQPHVRAVVPLVHQPVPDQLQQSVVHVSKHFPLHSDPLAVPAIF
jgi:hypothetical protein